MASSSNGYTPSANDFAKEEHRWKFREQVIPPRLFYLLREEKISLKDFLLLSVVNTLVKPQTDRPGIGCWASNKYLAEAINAHPMHVSKRIGVLEAAGLLVVCYLGDQRYLETEWSRTAEEREALEGEYGEVHRKAHRKLLKRLAKQGVSPDAYPPKPESLSPPSASRLTPPNPRRLPIDTVEDEGVGKGKNTSRSAEPTVVYEDVSTRLNGRHPSKPSKNGKHTSSARSHEDDPAPDTFERKCTNKLWDAVVRSFPDEMRRMRSKHHWDKQFNWLRKSRSEEEIVRVLDWYVTHLGDEYVPEAFSAKMFRLKFDPIRRAMLRTKKKQAEEMPIN